MLLYRTAGDHDYRVVPVETLYVLPGHLFEFLYTNGCMGAYGFSRGRAHRHFRGFRHLLVEWLRFANEFARANVEDTRPREAGARKEVGCQKEQGV